MNVYIYFILLIIYLFYALVSGYEGLASPLRVSGMGGGMTGGLLGGIIGSGVSQLGMSGSGKPATMRRGPGRPRTRGGLNQTSQPRPKKPIGLKFKRWKG